MFDLTSSKLLILGIVALLVVGPKDLPMLLRTLGKYIGIVKRHAAEFRAQFDEAMRDTELDQIRKDVAAIKSDAEGALREVTRTVDTHVQDATREIEKAAATEEAPPTPPAAVDASAAISDTAALTSPTAPADGSSPSAPAAVPAAIEVSELPPVTETSGLNGAVGLNGAHPASPAETGAQHPPAREGAEKPEGQPS